MKLLAKKLEREIEEKGIVPDNQVGFRRGRGVMEQIYTLNYIVGTQIREGKKRMVAFFVDLKAAFDMVERENLEEAMRERGVNGWLRERIMEAYGETKCCVRVGERVSEGFWTERGVRQGCPLSPLAFNVSMADMEERLREEGWGGVKVGGEKVYELAYSDDIVLMVEDEVGMKMMMRELERYMDEKMLRVNVDKSKVMRFTSGGGRWRKILWGWKGMKVEEVKEFVYLEYKIERNGRQGAHVKETVRKAMVVMREVWGIGKRWFGGDWRRWMLLFDKLMGTVLLYGAAVWGWCERAEIERVQEKYIRWVLGLEWYTPGYMIREKTKRGKLRTGAGRRALGMAERARSGKAGGIARRCLEEIRRKERGCKIEWVEERGNSSRKGGTRQRKWLERWLEVVR